MGILLAIVARILVYFLQPVLVVLNILFIGVLNSWSLRKRWDTLNRYFYNVAFGEDLLGNATGAFVFQVLFSKEGGYKFGNPRETISFVIAANYFGETLTKAGHFLRWILDTVDKDHTRKAWNNNRPDSPR